jgi:hypothetical protein
MKSWGEPLAGDILWGHFPDDIHPRPKPRPALVLTVFDDDAPLFRVEVAYGTSQKTTALRRGEFLIARAIHPTAYGCAGLSFDTKFALGTTVALPFDEDWFSVPPMAPHGQRPLLGTLHASLMRSLEAAYRATRDG